MRTTIDIPDEMYRKLKVKAALEGQTVREIALRAVQRELEATEPRPVRKLHLPLIPSSPPGTPHLTNEKIDELTAFS